MEITAEIDIDDIAREIFDSSEFERNIEGLVDNVVDDKIKDALGDIDVDDIDYFSERVKEIAQEIAQEVVDDALDEIKSNDMVAVQAAGNQADQIADLTEQVERLQNAVDALTEGLQAAAILLAAITKG